MAVAVTLASQLSLPLAVEPAAAVTAAAETLEPCVAETKIG